MPEMEGGVPEPAGRDCFNETVCIDAQRIYDSCGDKDCVEDIRVLFPTSRQPMIDNATSVRIKDVSVITVYIDLQPIPFNKGFYSVDMTYFFDVCVELFGGPNTCPVPVNGVAVFNKKVVLYGSEGNVKVFSSDACGDEVSVTSDNRALPTATVQVAEPVALSAKLCDRPSCDPYCRIPECISQLYGGELESAPQRNNVYVTIGLFTIVQIVRSVPMTVPASEFCVPEKECVPTSDNPCELFSRIDFPVGEFFPPKAGDCDCGCGCQK